MDGIIKKYGKKFGMTENELRKIINDAFCDEKYGERLVDIFGVENIEDISLICTSFPKSVVKTSLKIEEINLERYQENKFEVVPSRDFHGESSVPVSEVLEGKKYFPFEFFNHVQSTTFESVYRSDENFLVSAPTGCGKTEIAILAILRSLETQSGKIVYIAPMKALATEIKRKFERILNEKICEFTGDVELAPGEAKRYRIFVATPEKFEVVTRRRGNFFENTLSMLIIDEIHLLQDERGGVLESVVCRVLSYVESEQRHIRIGGMSATLPNVEDVANFIRAKRFFIFDETYRPVSLEISVVGVYKKRRGGKREETAGPGEIFDVCLEKIEECVSRKEQVLVFAHSRPDVIASAKKTAQTFELKKGPAKVFENNLFNELLAKEIGVHHAGLPRNVRHRMESLFLEGKIRILFCTSTLAWGVNLPATVVLVKGTTYYDPDKGKFVEIGPLDLIQIFGRAGRPQFEKMGRAVLITSKDKLEFFTKLLLRKTPIESRFLCNLVDFFNAEITLGNAEDLDRGMSWIKSTFLYGRMRKNPSLYGVDEKKETVEDVVKDYLLLSTRKLSECGMVVVRKGSSPNNHQSWKFVGTFLGRIASFHYVSHETISLWIKKIPETIGEYNILSLVFQSTEFGNIVCRADEEEALKDLCDVLEMEFVDDPGTKMFLLVVAMFKKMKIYSFSLLCDQGYIIHNLKRLLQAFVFVIVELGALHLFKTTVELLLKVRGIPKKDPGVVKEMDFYAAGDFLCIFLKTRFGDAQIKKNQEEGDGGMKYVMIETEKKIFCVEFFRRSVDFFVPAPHGDFFITVGGVDRNWSERLKVSANKIQKNLLFERFFNEFPCDNPPKKMIEIKDILESGESFEFVSTDRFSFQNSRFLVNFNVISDHSDVEINQKIFNFLDALDCPAAVVVEGEKDKASVSRYLKKQNYLADLRFLEEKGICTKERKVLVTTLENIGKIKKKQHVVFKTCKTPTNEYSIDIVFKTALTNQVTIFEKKGFCELFATFLYNF